MIRIPKINHEPGTRPGRSPYPRHTAFLCLCLLLLMSGCGQSGGSAAPLPASPAGQTFENPVIRSDFPDPSVLRVGNVYYAYATNAYGKNVQVARSSDLVHWDLLADALPALPSWAQPGGSLVWAPEVIQIDETYVLYYTARDMQSHKQCVGVATSSRPEGKFRDRSTRPLVCQADLGGTIDPSPFRENEKLYLYFKNDGNCCALTTSLYVQQLASDGLSLLGQPVRLVSNERLWEGSVVEAPTMFKHNNKYYLFFSANDYAGVNYAVGYALCQTPTGPCVQAAENPVLASRTTPPPPVIGPGGQALLRVGGQTWIIYHAWNLLPDGQRGDSRSMYIDRVTWQDDKPRVQGPTTRPQPLP